MRREWCEGPGCGKILTLTLSSRAQDVACACTHGRVLRAVAHPTCDELFGLGVAQVDQVDETLEAALELSLGSANSGDLYAAPHVCVARARAVGLEHGHVHLRVPVVGSEQPWGEALHPVRPKARARGGASRRRL